MSKITNRLIVVLFALFLTFVILKIFSGYHLFHIDQIGHIFSAHWFSLGYFHEYIDFNFLGYVQNLFYPPLEDFLIASFYQLTNYNYDLSYKLYLVVVLYTYFASFYFLIKKLDSPISRIFLLIGFVLILFLKKEANVNIQGLSLAEILRTGLNAQILSFSFFLLLLSNIYSKKENGVLSVIYLSLAILSHLVIGAISGLFWLIFTLTTKNKKRFVVGIFSLTLTSFFWLPFALYKSMLVPSTINSMTSYSFIALLLVLFIFLPRKQSLALILTGIILIVPELLEVFSLINLKFHFNRLIAPGIFISLIASAFIIDKRFPRWQKNYKRYQSLLYLGILLLIFFPFKYKNQLAWLDEKYQIHWPQIKNAASFNKDLKRYYSWHVNRPVDHHLDATLPLYNPKMLMSKGVYWEVSPNNNLISAMIATLDSVPTVVDYSYVYTNECEKYKCLANSIFNHFGISDVIVPMSIEKFYKHRKRKLHRFSDLQRSCLANHLSTSGKRELMFNFDKSIFQVRNLQDSKIIEAPKRISLVDKDSRKKFHTAWVVDVFNQCRDGIEATSLIDIHNYELPQNYLIQSSKNFNITYKRLSPGEYLIDTNSEEDVLVHFKIAYAPGMTLVSENDQEIKLYELLPGMVAKFKGKARLFYQKPPIMGFSYGLTFFGLVFFYRFRKSV